MTTGERIKYLREKNGFTQKDIATRLGVQPATVSKYELDMREPNIENIKKLATIFNVTTDYLLSFKKGIPTNIQNALNRFVKESVDLLGDRVKKIILYGSYARGDFNDSSDIDIMILTDLTDDEIVKYRKEISDIAYDIEWDNDFKIMLSPLIENEEKFNYWVEYLPFYMNVQKEGIVLSDINKDDKQN